MDAIATTAPPHRLRRHPMIFPRPSLTPMARAIALAATVIVALGSGACSSKLSEDPILRLSSQEAFDQGKQLMAEEKYARARDYLTHAFEVEPNSATGREALLLVADSSYLQGGRLNYIQAETKYRDFLNRFPTSDRAAYVQFQIANSLAQRIGRPDRDLSASREALQAYQDLLRLYPTSEYAAQAREKMRVVRQNLAEHELAVGDFYLSYGLPRAAADRFAFLLENYPGYEGREVVLYKLGVAQAEGRLPEEARQSFARLREEFPGSSYLNDLPELPAPQPEEEAAAEDGDDADTDQEESAP
jgi:outer membrane protein assembly factor BamD